jgi:hypothetical protein
MFKDNTAVNLKQRNPKIQVTACTSAPMYQNAFMLDKIDRPVSFFVTQSITMHYCNSTCSLTCIKLSIFLF